MNSGRRARRRSANVALMYSGSLFGGAVSSLISMSIEPAHWRWIFIAGGVAPLIIAPIMLAKLRESPAFERMHGALALAGSADSRTADNPRPGSFFAIFAAGRAI